MKFENFTVLQAGAIYGLYRYTSIFKSRMAKDEGDPELSRETSLVFGFKTQGRQRDRIGTIIRAVASYLGCDTILAAPSSQAGELNTLQELFGETIKRVTTVPRRKYNHKPVTPEYRATWEVEPEAVAGRRVLLVDDVCTSGHTLRHFAGELTALGADVELLAVGLNVKLNPEPSFTIVMPSEALPTPRGSQGLDLELSEGCEVVGVREFGRLVGVSHAAIVDAINAGRLTAVVQTRNGRKLKRDEALLEWEACRSSRTPEGSSLTGDLIEGVPEAFVSDSGLTWAQEKTKQDCLLARERRLLLDRELRELEGELHRADDVAAVWADLLVRFRAKCLGLPSTVAPIIAAIPNPDAARIQAELEIHMREALSELANYDPRQIQAAAKKRAKSS